jgi:hypothetical protein
LFRSGFAAAHDSGNVSDREVVDVPQPDSGALSRREPSHGGDKLWVDFGSKAIRRGRIPSRRERHPRWYAAAAQAVDDREEPGPEVTSPRRPITPSAEGGLLNDVLGLLGASAQLPREQKGRPAHLLEGGFEMSRIVGDKG